MCFRGCSIGKHSDSVNFTMFISSSLFGEYLPALANIYRHAGHQMQSTSGEIRVHAFYSSLGSCSTPGTVCNSLALSRRSARHVTRTLPSEDGVLPGPKSQGSPYQKLKSSRIQGRNQGGGGGQSARPSLAEVSGPARHERRGQRKVGDPAT